MQLDHGKGKEIPGAVAGQHVRKSKTAGQKVLPDGTGE